MWKLQRNGKILIKIPLPWKRQNAWTKTCHIKMLPDKF